MVSRPITSGGFTIVSTRDMTRGCWIFKGALFLLVKCSFTRIYKLSFTQCTYAKGPGVGVAFCCFIIIIVFFMIISSSNLYLEGATETLSQGRKISKYATANYDVRGEIFGHLLNILC